MAKDVRKVKRARSDGWGTGPEKSACRVMGKPLQVVD